MQWQNICLPWFRRCAPRLALFILRRGQTQIFSSPKINSGESWLREKLRSCPRFRFSAQILNATENVPFRQTHHRVLMRSAEAGRAVGRRTPSLSLQSSRWYHGRREPRGLGADPGTAGLGTPPHGPLPRRRWGIRRCAAAPTRVCKCNQP